MANDPQEKGSAAPGAPSAPSPSPGAADATPTGAGAAGKPVVPAPAKATGATAAGAAKAEPAAAAPPAAAPKPQPVDEFDPLGWEVPLVCKECDKTFTVPYRHFHAGVVFHCPHCNGSWVPNTTISKTTRRVFEEFWGARKRAREAFERGELELEADQFEQRQAAELAAFNERLYHNAHEMRPAGKLVRHKGLGAMFT